MHGGGDWGREGRRSKRQGLEWMGIKCKIVIKNNDKIILQSNSLRKLRQHSHVPFEGRFLNAVTVCG